MAEIRLERITKSFGRVQVIKGVDLDIHEREFVVFVGPSGCGKSTLLRLVAGLEDISSGRLFIDGKVVNELTPAERGIAMVFQSYALYPHMTVLENMAFGLKLASADKAAAERRVRDAARILQLDHPLEREPRPPSGGERPRGAGGGGGGGGGRSGGVACAPRAFPCSTSRSRTSTPRSGCRCGSR